MHGEGSHTPTTQGTYKTGRLKKGIHQADRARTVAGATGYKMHKSRDKQQGAVTPGDSYLKGEGCSSGNRNGH